MPAEAVAWFELRAERGVDHAENLQPIVEIGLSIALPQIVGGGDVLPTASARTVVRQAPALTDDVQVRIIPNTRIVETSTLEIASTVLATGLFDQIDKPTKKAIASAESETKACVQAHEKRYEAVESGDAEHPAARDIIPPGDPAPSGAVSIPADIPTDADED